MAVNDVTMFKLNIMGFLNKNYPQVVQKIKDTKKLSADITEQLDKAIMEFFKKK